jgi:predicted metalloprotease with PDZ domain
VRPYSFEDVVADLNSVQPYPWRKLLLARITSLSPDLPLEGLARSGWKLVFSEQPTEFITIQQSLEKRIDMRYSLGLLLSTEGEVLDVVAGTPAAKAGASPGTKLVAVNRRKFSSEVLLQELKLAKGSSQPMELLVTSGQYYLTLRADYHSGERYPQLVRDESRPDMLSDILRSRAVH